MITLEQHLKNNAARIVDEARVYAKSYKVTMAKALHDVEDEYAQGWHEEAAMRDAGDCE